jgi:hypothetical protein
MTPTPIPFWDSPLFTNAILALIAAVIIYLQTKTNAKVDKTADKVAVIETHTNGMLTALQTTVDSQKTEAMHVAAMTEKDKEIAALTPKPEVKP